MNLNKMSLKAYEIARARLQYVYDGRDGERGLKHCAGEVVEACNSYNEWIYNAHKTEGAERKAEFAGELADVITCVLSLCGYFQIDIEQALKDCMKKNEARA